MTTYADSHPDSDSYKHRKTAVTDAAIAQTADATADLIEARGHWQGDAEGPEGQLCAVEALFQASGNGSRAVGSRVQDELEMFLGLQAGLDPSDELCPLAYWNDNQATTEEVVQAFRDLATKFRPDETGGA